MNKVNKTQLRRAHKIMGTALGKLEYSQHILEQAGYPSYKNKDISDAKSELIRVWNELDRMMENEP